MIADSASLETSVDDDAGGSGSGDGGILPGNSVGSVVAKGSGSGDGDGTSDCGGSNDDGDWFSSSRPQDLPH